MATKGLHDILFTTVLGMLFFQTLSAPIDMTYNFKIAVIVEENMINDTLVEYAITRRVNKNYRVLGVQTMSYTLIKSAWCDTTATVKQVCATNGYSGMITVGSCGLIDQTNRLSTSLQIPHIGIPSSQCEETLPTNYGVIGRYSPTHLMNAAAAIFAFKKAPTAAIYFDNNQSLSMIQYLQDRLTSKSIRSFAFQIDSAGSISATTVVGHMTRMIKKKINNIIIVAEPSNVDQILVHAKTAKILQQNYFWAIIDTGVTKYQVLSAVPSNANIGIVRGSQFGANVPGKCPASVLDVFPDCNTDWIKGLDVRFVDAVAALAKAYNDSLNVGDPWYPSNASCTGQTWLTGSNVYTKLLALNNYDTFRGMISYDATTKYFNTGEVEFVSAYNYRKTSPTEMITSATYNTATDIVTSNIKLKGQKFVFANTFVGFKNETLMFCSPEIPPFTTFVKVHPNKSLESSGMLNDLLDIFSKQLEFKYTLKVPADGQWGGPLAGQPYYSGCVGEVQAGIADLGGGPFTKTTVRDKVIDYSYPLFEEANGLLLPRPPPATKLWNVFTPFNYDVWILVIAFMFLSAFITFILAYYSPFTAWNLNLSYAIADEIWFQEYLWSSLGSFLQQGQDFYPFAMAPRTILAFWWLFTVVVFGTYTGDLTAHLTITITTVPIKTLDDLVAQSAILPAIPIGTNIHTLFLETHSGIYKQVRDMMVEVADIPECADVVFNKGQGCITDYTFQLNFAKQNCSQVYLAEQLFNTATVAFLYAEDAYFSELFDFYFEKLHESGVMQQLFTKYWSSDAVCSVGSSAEADPINIEGVGGALMVTGGFYCLGFILLALEFFWTKLLKKEPLDFFLY